LDVNPFTATGITTAQMSVLDSLLVWMALQPSAPMTADEMAVCRDNSTKVVMEGRKPGLTLMLDDNSQVLTDAATHILAEVQQVAQLLDGAQLATNTAASNFADAVAAQQVLVNNPDALLSGQVLATMKAQGLEHNDFILNLANKYKKELIATNYEHWDDVYFSQMQRDSVAQQQQIEAADTVDFDAFLADYFSNTKK